MPKTTSALRTALVALVFAPSLTGCAGRPISVSPGLAEATVKHVGQKVDRKSINFDDYQVREIRRGWERGGSVSVGVLSAQASTRDFSFSVGRGGVSMQVRCTLNEEAAGIGDLVVDSTAQVTCDLNPSNAAAPWKVILVQKQRAVAQGRVQQGTRELQIVPAHGSGHRRSRGYLIREEGDIAAADVGRKTRAMWLPKQATPEESLALAGAAMALMLLEEVK